MKPGRTARLIISAALALCLSAGLGFGYYPFVHYTTSQAPYQIAPEKFDLNALPGRTLYYYVSPRGPESLAPGDSFTALLSQIRLAAKAWSAIGTSALRFEFGGLSAPDTVQSTPGVDVLFGEVELPPGLIALGGPISRSELISTDSGSFVPITRSVLVLGKDLSQRPSHSDAFFLTVVHELGHALGLQHTLTSSVMSTEVTRSTTRAKPIAPDDAAGISMLYPAPEFSKITGRVSGRVTLDGQGVHLASVVALEPVGTAVSALTDPEGNYTIAGLSPGQYYVYVHPLPPGGQTGLGPADIVLPVNSSGNPVPAGPLFETMFHPATKNIAEATVVTVLGGETLTGYDLAVKGRGPLDVYGVTTYSFPGNYAVRPAFLNVNGGRRFLVAGGRGLIANNAPSAGLRAMVVGGSAAVLEDGVKAYAPAPSYLQLDFSFNPFGGEGPRHLIFSLNGDISVLPGGLHLVRSQPPSIGSVTPANDDHGRPIAVIAGSNLVSSTRVLFDGLPATVAGQNSTNGDLTVIPPPGAAGHHAVVVALDTDGQDSTFLDGPSPLTYSYPAGDAPSITVSPSALPAGTEAMVEITGVNTAFRDGQTVAGFGSSDVTVRRLWAAGPGRLLANVHTSASAQMTGVPLTVVTGFQVATQAAALQIQPTQPDIPVINPVLINPLTGQPSIYAGGQAVMEVKGSLAGLTPGRISLTLEGLPAQVTGLQDNRITFVVPVSLAIGPAILRLSTGAAQIYPIVVAIDPAPPVIQQVLLASGSPVSTGDPTYADRDVYLIVSGLAEPAVVSDPALIKIVLAGVPQTPISVSAHETDPNINVIRFRVSAAVKPAADAQLTVAIGSRVSQPVTVVVGTK